MQQKDFPNFSEMTPRVPQWLWMLVRICVLGATGFVLYLLFVHPPFGLVLFWQIVIPLLPLSFAVIPGFWRNICPMAFLNQIPRMTGIGLERTLPPFVANIALSISIFSFIALVFFRPLLFNHNGTAIGILICVMLVLAFVGGLVFKGRSGWCGTLCPMAPIQKVYGQAPLVMVRNGYCSHCVGCQKNCYDFNPRAAVFSDLNSSDKWWSDKRKYFGALLPGLIIGYYNTLYAIGVPLTEYFLTILIPPLLSVGLYHSLKNIFHLTDYRLYSVFGLSALTIFYFFGGPIFLDGLEQLFGIKTPGISTIAIRVGVVLITLAVVIRGILAEKAFLRSQSASSQVTVGTGVNILKAAIEANQGNALVLERSSGKQFSVDPDHSLLDAMESAELPIMAGCRMGMCGADPVVIVEGMEDLEPPCENELITLRRLGYEGKARLACCCKPKSRIEIDLSLRPEDVVSALAEVPPTEINIDENKLKVIIIGNGIAGISTAEGIREQDRDVHITLISEEPHHFYNRMGLERVVHGRAGMQGLYLMKEEWYKSNNIDVWLNTRVSSINRDKKEILIGSGEVLPYDKLVLATGARSFKPPIPGIDKKGCFTLRDAADAIAMRAWVQRSEPCKFVTILGGGVLGIEAASALSQLGLRVTIINSSHQLMRPILDLQAAAILKKFLANSGIDVLLDTGIERVEGEDKLSELVLNDGAILSSDLLLICTGVRANIDLAKSAGLEINKGVIVDASMQSSDEDIYCAGDAAELPGAIAGLWAVGNEQGKVVAAAILDEDKQYRSDTHPHVQLKVDGIDLVCFGNFGQEGDAQSYSGGDIEDFHWKHLLVKDGKLVAGVFVDEAMSANLVVSALKREHSVFTTKEIKEMMGLDSTDKG
jgi:nitrite reductase (NADH) large subunit